MSDTTTNLYIGAGVVVALIAGYFGITYLGNSGKDLYPNVNSTATSSTQNASDASSIADWKGGRKTKKSKSKNKKTKRKH
jgi:hypothetical protein